MGKVYYADEIRKKRRIKALVWGVIVALVLILGGTVAGIYGDYLEVREIGANFVPAFFKNLVVRGTFSVISFVLVFAVTFISTNVLRRNLLNAGAEHTFLKKRLLIALACVVVAFIGSTYFSWNLYEKFLQMRNAVPFGITDPLFFKDIGYFVFERPFIRLLLEGVSSVWLLITIYIAVAYAVLFFKFGERTAPDLVRNKKIVRHIAVNVALFMLIKAFSVWINAQGVVLDQFGELTGGGFAEVNIWLNFYRVAPFVLIAITLIAIILVIKRRFLPAILTCLSYFAIIICVQIVSWGVQVFHVSPNEVAVQAPYIQHNLDYTKKAYGLDNVIETEYVITDEPQNIAVENKETIDNIRIIDFPATVTATNQLQGIRNYYTFNDLDVGVYNINGEKQAVAVGPREIDKEKLDESARNYINEKFRFTHGYGVAMTSFTQVDSQGQPYYFIKDLVQEKTEGVPYVTQPRVYFGELTNDEVIVNTKTRELDYPEGTADHEFDYDGSAGIGLTPLNRFLFAFRTGDFRMLIANQITSESRLLTNRNVIDRVKKVAPFLRFDGGAQMVIDDDGTLKWVVDGYTHTNQFPYAQMTDDFNYVRNSVKAVVDAYQGTVKLYIIDKNDPIILTYKNIYPDLFESGDIPASVMGKTRYPEWLFSVQCRIYAQYHVHNATAFYNKNDMYSIANEKYEQEIKPIEPYYNIMQLAEFGNKDPQLVLMMPYTPVNRENMVAWIAAGNEGEDYGKLVLYKFPKSFNIYGPLQVENLIDNNPDISREMTLWNTGGSNVIRGNLLVIPVSGGILYVEPVYLNSKNQASLPSLKRVIAAYGDKVAMKETLAEALETVLGEKIAPPVAPDGEITENEGKETEDISGDAVERLIEVYDRLEKDAGSGDWEAFGKSMNELGKVVDQFRKE